MQKQSADPRLKISRAKAFLIGGVPRSGKTTVAQIILKRRPMFATSTDSIRSVQKSLVSKSDYPNLFVGSAGFSESAIQMLCGSGRAHEIVDLQNRESEAVWPAVKQFIESNIAEGNDVLVEGVALLPKLISSLECEYEAIFLGNTAHSRPAIKHAAHENRLDWMHEFGDRTFDAFTKFTVEHSRYYQRECARYKFRYVEITDDTFIQDIHAVAETFS